MASKQADVLVGRRYLTRGYLDQALELFTRNADTVATVDWSLLRDKLLDRGEQETNQAKRALIYKQANRLIAQQVPGVPYAHSVPALGMQKRVRGYFTSPIGTDLFKTVFFGGQ